jgi:AraC-like DNA-binding protein
MAQEIIERRVNADTPEEEIYRTTIILNKLPHSTPPDARIYIAGNFNEWLPDNPNYILTKNDNGLRSITIEHFNEPIFFKLTRGSWRTVEARANGRARSNRKHVPTQKSETIFVDISSWEDLSDRKYGFFMYPLLIMALHCLYMIILLNSLSNKNKRANLILSGALFLIGVALLSRASTFDPAIFTDYPKLILLPELILFTYAPLFLLYIKELLSLEKPDKSLILLSMAPVLVQIALFVPYLFLENQIFIHRIIDRDLFGLFAWSGVVGFLYNLGYWIYTKKLVNNFSQAHKLNGFEEKYLRFIKKTLWIKSGYLTLWAVIGLVYISGETSGIPTLPLTELLIDIFWFSFSLLIFALAYYAIKNPEVFRVEKAKTIAVNSDAKESRALVFTLESAFEEEKVHQDPDLNLQKLSRILETSPHSLSKVINQEYNKTFSALINQRRIQDYLAVAKADPEAFQKMNSYFTLASKLGFNSKPTFNRAFKKETGVSPSDYFERQNARA